MWLRQDVKEAEVVADLSTPAGRRAATDSTLAACGGKSPTQLAADELAAGLAARLDAGLNWDVTDFSLENGELQAKRPALGDTVVVDVGWTSTPRIALVRGMLMNHVIHHRGQLSVYLRLAGVKVPSIYGPTADETWM